MPLVQRQQASGAATSVFVAGVGGQLFQGHAGRVFEFKANHLGFSSMQVRTLSCNLDANLVSRDYLGRRFIVVRLTRSARGKGINTTTNDREPWLFRHLSTDMAISL
jgi:hypothetical protein